MRATLMALGCICALIGSAALHPSAAARFVVAEAKASTEYQPAIELLELEAPQTRVDQVKLREAISAFAARYGFHPGRPWHVGVFETFQGSGTVVLAIQSDLPRLSVRLWKDFDDAGSYADQVAALRAALDPLGFENAR